MAYLKSLQFAELNEWKTESPTKAFSLIPYISTHQPMSIYRFTLLVYSLRPMTLAITRVLPLHWTRNFFPRVMAQRQSDMKQDRSRYTARNEMRKLVTITNL